MSETPSKRRWLRFSLRSLFVVLTAAASLLCLWNHDTRLAGAYALIFVLAMIES